MKKIFVVFALFCVVLMAVSCDSGRQILKSPDAGYEDSDKTDDDTDATDTADDSGDSLFDNDADSSDSAGDSDNVWPDSGNSTDDSDTSEQNENDSEQTGGNDTDNSDTETDDDPVVIVESLDYESGFIDLEEISYTLSNKSNKSGRAKIWYDFQPADENPQDKPLFVLYNGGPGSSSSLIFLYNTSRKTADQAFAGEGVADNQWNWNKLGNLLYIDARQTGFSYGIVDNPSSSSARSNYFSTANFNVFVDAADFIRVILRFLETHPKIKSNPVVLAGESYGGTRTTAVINILLNVADYAQKNRVFYDQALFNEIAAHFQGIDSTVTGMPSTEVVAKQFGRQIMIQPLAMGQQQLDAIGEVLEKSNSPLYTIQQETGKKYSPCGSSWNCDKYNRAVNYVRNAGRDIYSYRREYNWLFDYTDYGIAKMLQFTMFKQFIMNDPTKIENLYAANRTGAFRYKNVSEYSRNIADLDKLENVPESVKIILKARIEQRNAHPLSTGDLESVFGTLPQYDEYYVDTNDTILSTFYDASVDPYDDVNGEMFLENIRTAKTFITKAEEDIILYAEATPEAAKKFSNVSSVETGDESFTVHFKDGESATVTFPFYPESSHSVSVNQPEKFLNDVKKWMN
jgi:Carboxypeptidase C (cathepsin A)